MSLLEQVPNKSARLELYRFAVIPRNDDLLNASGLDEQGVIELKEILAASSGPYLDQLCDAPFRAKKALPRRTRFSDGSYPVFYSSLDPQTAEAELEYLFPKIIGQPEARRTAYYQRFSCTFEGAEKDLRPKLSDWPDLVHQSDYTFCNRLGAEAVKLGLDGLVTPSARKKAGVNTPVFKRHAISNPEERGEFAVTLDPITGQVTMKQTP